ncbi:hypothetical protein [Enterococcus sp. AZ102]|uniref:hypothetical protein n=1 Tax=Enterococcus sp. AZ102 TaxID=2774865 RepID=UPI003F261CD8
MSTYYKKSPIRLKWYLSHWKGYVVNREWLSERERYFAVIFFKSLKRLDQEELIFLKEKYYTDIPSKSNIETDLIETYKQHSDETMANQLGMDVKDYREKRVRLENKLKRIIEEVQQEQNLLITNEAEEFTLKAGKLYLKSYDMSFLGRISPDYVLTQDGKQAKIFHKDDESVDEFIFKLGMEKEPIKESEYDYIFNCVYHWKK